MRLLAVLLSLFFPFPVFATTIAYDGHSLAADSQLTIDDDYKTLFNEKLKIVNGDAMGCSGILSDIQAFEKWYRSGGKGTTPKLTRFSGLVMRPDGTCVQYDEECLPRPIKAPHAVGNGGKLAIAAMKAGATARRAVEISCELDLYSSGPVHTITLTQIRLLNIQIQGAQKK